jgi:2-oxoglutarate dehydrogenase E1 component
MKSDPQWPAESNVAFIEEMYSRYLERATSVPDEWRAFFEELTLESGSDGRTGWRSGPSFSPSSIFNPSGVAAPGSDVAPKDAAGLQGRVDKLVREYRVRGHMIAQFDPLGLPRLNPVELDPAYHGLTEPDLAFQVSPLTLSGTTRRTVREVLETLRRTYCRSIGVQFMHIDHGDVREWLQRRMEGSGNRITLERSEQIRIFTRLTDAVTFEEFIQKKYVGAKSFSLEGSESLIPLLDLAIEKAGADGVREIVIGMAHRGRLNVLANIMGKSPRQIFREFEDVDNEGGQGPGDVKYHLGYSADWRTVQGEHVHLSLCFNPSHLEFVNPVAEGRMRAKQDRVHDTGRTRGLVVLIHGDAAFAGQGVVQETLNLSELAGYRTGGTIHIVVNNQIGFTTAPEEARSGLYATALAKMLQIPIFHVNGEDPEAVAQVTRLALDFRAEFQRDVVIDMYGYRRHGHNEGDEPSFTQPVMYRAISQRKSVQEGYLEHLLTLGGVTREEAEAIAAERRRHLEEELSVARSDDYVWRAERSTGIWAGYLGGRDRDVPDIDTGVRKKRLAALLERLSRLPDDFHPHPRVKRLVQQRHEMAEGKRGVDWSTAETLAFATLATEGVRIRLSGQDSGRGTFSQRHAILHDNEDGHRYVPLQHLTPAQAHVDIINSPLSEVGVLGFEYGYSLDCPDGLVIWEAQFGDFWNAAQVIVDQFIASAEYKWKRLSGLVLLLPHGFEGQGPEHSSARLERFLLLAAEDNLQIAYPTTPGQYFHLLRRQVVRPIRKPLVVMTPKSLLRDPRMASPLAECAAGRFRRLIPDDRDDYSAVRHILLTTGKVYYDLAEARQAEQRNDVAIIRVEQLYPLDDELVEAALAPFGDDLPVRWVQEEPANQGAWPYLRTRFGDTIMGRPLSCVARPESASPAAGSTSRHKQEQRDLVARALSPDATSQSPRRTKAARAV